MKPGRHQHSLGPGPQGVSVHCELDTQRGALENSSRQQSSEACGVFGPARALTAPGCFASAGGLPIYLFTVWCRDQDLAQVHMTCSQGDPALCPMRKRVGSRGRRARSRTPSPQRRRSLTGRGFKTALQEMEQALDGAAVSTSRPTPVDQPASAGTMRRQHPAEEKK